MKQFEPLRKTRYRIEFEEPFNGVKDYSVKETSKPKLKNGCWENIEIKFYDIIGESSSYALMQGISVHQNNNYALDSIEVNYSITLLDSKGVSVSKWEITGNIVEIDFGNLSYDDNDICIIKLVVKPKRVISLY